MKKESATISYGTKRLGGNSFDTDTDIPIVHDPDTGEDYISPLLTGVGSFARHGYDSPIATHREAADKFKDYISEWQSNSIGRDKNALKEYIVRYARTMRKYKEKHGKYPKQRIIGHSRGGGGALEFMRALNDQAPDLPQIDEFFGIDPYDFRSAKKIDTKRKDGRLLVRKSIVVRPENMSFINSDRVPGLSHYKTNLGNLLVRFAHRVNPVSRKNSLSFAVPGTAHNSLPQLLEAAIKAHKAGNRTALRKLFASTPEDEMIESLKSPTYGDWSKPRYEKVAEADYGPDSKALLAIAKRLKLKGLDVTKGMSRKEMSETYNGIGNAGMNPRLRAALTRHWVKYTPAAFLHDLQFAKGGTEDDWREANRNFKENLDILTRTDPEMGAIKKLVQLQKNKLALKVLDRYSHGAFHFTDGETEKAAMDFTGKSDAYRRGFMSKLADFRGMKRVPFTEIPWWNRFVPWSTAYDDMHKSEVDFNLNVDRMNDEYVRSHPEFYQEAARDVLGDDIPFSPEAYDTVGRAYFNASDRYPVLGSSGNWTTSRKNPSNWIRDDGTVGKAPWANSIRRNANSFGKPAEHYMRNDMLTMLRGLGYKPTDGSWDKGFTVVNRHDDSDGSVASSSAHKGQMVAGGGSTDSSDKL